MRLIVLSLVLGVLPTQVLGQAAAAFEATIESDSIRVGDAFTVRLSVTQDQPGDVEFPALIELPEALEQQGPLRIRSTNGGRDWEAEYTLVAWRADTLVIPAIEVELGAAGSSARPVVPPAVVVHTVLTADEGELELRDSRPFLRVRGFPWWLALLIAALAGLAWWTWRRRAMEGGDPAGVPIGPGDLALRELDLLRESWLEGRVKGDRFYDDYESTLRRYAHATRGWAPSKGLKGLGGRESGMFEALWHSVLARFARVRPGQEGPVADIDAGAAFVRSEMPPRPTTSAAAPAPAPDSGARPDPESSAIPDLESADHEGAS